ncbi:MAG: hypothetical protein U5L04_09545 [Trueperaceae bacterium]|nr:hypothetical protein [Trueperaceae bacterium]
MAVSILSRPEGRLQLDVRVLDVEVRRVSILSRREGQLQRVGPH